MKTLTKEEAAEDLARHDFTMDEDTLAIYRVTSVNEDDLNEPLKLLKVNEDTPPIGILPINFPSDERTGILFRYLLTVVTPEEFNQIEVGRLRLPEGWQLGNVIETRSAASKAAA